MTDTFNRNHKSISDAGPLIYAIYVDLSTQTVKLKSEDMLADPAVLLEIFKCEKHLQTTLK